jgi:ATP-dependent Clp protease ATP-binding subunit ClpA
MNSLDEKLLEQLTSQGISVKPINSETLVLRNVPTDANHYNKERTNVLVRYIKGLQRYLICVDADLEYTGTNSGQLRAFRLPKARSGWRPVFMEHLPREITSAIIHAFRVLGTEPPYPVTGSNSTIPAPQSVNRYEPGEFLKPYTTDLTKRALLNRLSPTVGRQKEMNLVLAVLKKEEHPRMPVLLGGAGCGKTNLIHGITFSLITDDDPLKVLSVDIVGLISGCVYPGERENWLNRAFDEMIALQDHVFVIEDINLLANSCPDGVLILRRALDEKIRLIGTSCTELIRIYQNPLIQRRIFIIPLAEPSLSFTVDILDGIKSILEKHHRINISTASIQCCVAQCTSWPGNFPAKAIDLLDLACSQLALKRGRNLSPDDIIEAAQAHRSCIQRAGTDDAVSFSD